LPVDGFGVRDGHRALYARTKKDSPGWASRAVNEGNLCRVMGTRRRWYSAQAGKPTCRAGEAAEHRDNENDTFHHGALLLKDQSADLNMLREPSHAREVGCALRLASSEARHRHQAAVERNGAQTSPIAASRLL
jgi:hypothetical protein